MRYTNDMTCHVWANKSEDKGQNNNGTIFFDSGIIYSYGHHFPMAKQVNDCTLITSQSYSSTTAQHISLVSRAVSGLIFYVHNVLADNAEAHTDNFKQIEKEVNELLIKASRARKAKEYLLNQAINLIDNANEYAVLFNLKLRLNKLDINLEEIKRGIVKKEKETREKLKAYYLTNRIKWLRGEHIDKIRSLPIMLRLKDTETITTSQFASFPLTDFIKLWPIVSRMVIQTIPISMRMVAFLSCVMALYMRVSA